MTIAKLSHAPQVALAHSISPAPHIVLPEYDASSESKTALRSRRDLPFVNLEASNSAKELVEKSDCEMAIKYAFALAEAEASTGSAETNNWNPQRISNIAPYSTFGMAWSNFAHALKAEPFATFVRTHNIDTSTLRWNPNYGGNLEGQVNGKITTFGDHVPGWTQASAALKAAANLLRDRFTYTNENSAPAGLVASFYGASPSPKDRLAEIGNLLSTGSFPGLSGSKKPYHRVIIEDQRQAIQAVASLRASGQIPAAAPGQTVATQVEQADKEVARLSAIALLARRNEIPREDARPTSGYVITPPEHSTLGRTITAFNHAFQAEAVLDFVQKKNLDTSNLHIRLPAGDLVAFDAVNHVFRTLARVNDQSGWAQVSAQIRALANTLGEGTNELVPYTADGSISLNKALIFYGAPPAPSLLAGALAHSAMLFQKGFPALNPDTPPTDERSREVQQRQRAVIQQLETPGTSQPPENTPPALNPLAAIAHRQFAGEPSVYTVIARLLGDKIKASHPALDIDVNQLAIAAPDPNNPGQLKHTQLMTLALNYLTGGNAANFTSGHQAFDTRPDLLAHTGTPANVPIALDLPALGAAIRDLPGQLNDAYEADSREYWNKPAFNTSTNTTTVYPGSHRALISSILRSNLQLAVLKQPGLDDEQRTTVDIVVRHPDGSTRPAPVDPNTSGTTVYSFSGSSPNRLIHRALSQPDREILLLVEPSGKITPYNTWDDVPNPRHQLELVTGNMFDVQAETLIKQHQGERLFSDPPPTGTAPTTQATSTLPGWLTKAGEAERFVAHELSLRLASIMQLNKGRTYNSGIPDIRTYIQNQFDKLPPRQKLTTYPAKELEVVYVSPANTLTLDPQSVQYERTRMSLADMLMNDLAGQGLPRGGVFEVYHKPSQNRVPALEGEGVLRNLFSTLDAGKHYTELLKRELLDNPTKKAERLSLFTQQIPAELQLKALQLSIEGKNGFNTTGFRYIQEIFKPGSGTRTVDGEEITIRPLAFNRKADHKTDVVDGAYLIEPKDPQAGPHILYRPLSPDAQLLQFPTRQALLEEIQKPGKLNKEVLAWMPDDTTRKIYSGSGFIHPNVVLFGLKIPFLADAAGTSTNELTTDEPEAAQTLQQKLVTGQLINHLYDANAQNLASLADSQTTTDAASRWATFKEGGFLILSALLPVLRGPGAVLGALLQAAGFIEDLDALSDDDLKNDGAALTDLLFNLAMLLLQFKAQPAGAPTSSRSVLAEDTTPLPPQNRIVLGGPIDIKPLAGDIQVFVDTYNDGQRLNIVGHGAKPKGQQPGHIIGEDGKRYVAEDIDNELLARGIDIRNYREVRLLSCYSANGGEQSLAAKLSALTGTRVKGYVQEIITDHNSVDQEDPFSLYEDAAANYRELYPSLSDSNVHFMAETAMNRKLTGRDINFNIMKEHGKEIEINIGTDEKPVLYRTRVDYQPRTYQPTRASVAPAQEIEVMMGHSQTAEDAHSVLMTRGLADCSALAVLTDLKDGVYQKRTLMHLTGTNLAGGGFNGDIYQLLDELDGSLASGGKVIFVFGTANLQPGPMGDLLAQKHQGRKPLLDILKKPGVESTIASSGGITVQPDGRFELREHEGQGIFSQPTLNKIYTAAELEYGK